MKQQNWTNNKPHGPLLHAIIHHVLIYLCVFCYSVRWCSHVCIVPTATNRKIQDFNSCFAVLNRSKNKRQIIYLSVNFVLLIVFIFPAIIYSIFLILCFIWILKWALQEHGSRLSDFGLWHQKSDCWTSKCWDCSHLCDSSVPWILCSCPHWYFLMLLECVCWKFDYIEITANLTLKECVWEKNVALSGVFLYEIGN